MKRAYDDRASLKGRKLVPEKYKRSEYFWAYSPAAGH
jgi:hypothetical protein